jgi:hypothetical protein
LKNPKTPENHGRKFVNSHQNDEELIKDNKLLSKKITIMNFKIGQLKGEIKKAKGLLMMAMQKEEILGENNRGLVEKNFG